MNYLELYVDQGATFTSVITVEDPLTGGYINVSGYVVTSQLRRSYYSANATANITCAVTDAANGKITMSLTAGQTANIKAGRYLFDVKATDTQNTTTRLVEGTIAITPDVTR